MKPAAIKYSITLATFSLLILLSGCRCGGSSTNSGMERQTGLERFGFTLLDADLPAPEFSITSVDGKLYTLSNQNELIVILHLWGSWIPESVNELMSLQQLQRDLGEDKIVILTVNSSEPQSAIVQFCNKNRIELPVLFDIGQEIAANYSSGNLPTTYLIDKKGYTIARSTETVSWSNPDLLEIIRKLTNQ